MTNDAHRGQEYWPHTIAQYGRPRGDRGESTAGAGDDRERPRADADGRSGGCAGKTPRPRGSYAGEEENSRVLLTDGGRPEERFEVVTKPEHGAPGTAGVGVGVNRVVADGPRVTIEQLWPNGDTDRIYVEKEDIVALIFHLAEIAMELQEEDSP